MVNRVLKHDGYFMTYFHPWEFVDHPKEIRKYLLPIVNRNIGKNMCTRLDKLITHYKSQGQDFDTLENFVVSYKKKGN